MGWFDWLFPPKPKPVPTPVPPTPNTSRNPRNFYCLLEGKGTQTYPDAVWNNPNVEGFTFRDKWYFMQPGPKRYDFSRLDKFLAKIEGKGKKWKFTVMTGAASPEWLYSSGVKGMKFKRTNLQNQSGNPEFMPVPWDDTYLKYYADFLAELAKRYDNHPLLTLFHIGGPTRDSLEMHLPDEVTQQVGYSKEAIIRAWRISIDNFRERFKTCNGGISIANPISGNDGIAKVVADYFFEKLGTRGYVQHCQLSAKSANGGNNIHNLVKAYGLAGKNIGFEQVDDSAASRYGGTFASSLLEVVHSKGKYLDFYKPDLGYIKTGLQ